MPSKAQLDAALAHVDAHIDESLERLKALIRIKSISTDPAYAGEVQRAADWLVEDLKSEAIRGDGDVSLMVEEPALIAARTGSDVMTTSTRTMNA